MLGFVALPQTSNPKFSVLSHIRNSFHDWSKSITVQTIISRAGVHKSVWCSPRTVVCWTFRKQRVQPSCVSRNRREPAIGEYWKCPLMYIMRLLAFDWVWLGHLSPLDQSLRSGDYDVIDLSLGGGPLLSYELPKHMTGELKEDCQKKTEKWRHRCWEGRGWSPSDTSKSSHPGASEELNNSETSTERQLSITDSF